MSIVSAKVTKAKYNPAWESVEVEYKIYRDGRPLPRWSRTGRITCTYYPEKVGTSGGVEEVWGRIEKLLKEHLVSLRRDLDDEFSVLIGREIKLDS